MQENESSMMMTDVVKLALVHVQTYFAISALKKCNLCATTNRKCVKMKNVNVDDGLLAVRTGNPSNDVSSSGAKKFRLPVRPANKLSFVYRRN